jgi:hypothetical protein
VHEHLKKPCELGTLTAHFTLATNFSSSFAITKNLKFKYYVRHIDALERRLNHKLSSIENVGPDATVLYISSFSSLSLPFTFLLAGARYYMNHLLNEYNRESLHTLTDGVCDSENYLVVS